MSIYDLIIVGAGPAGISAAYTAKQLSLTYLVIEQKQIANTISQYPLGKQLFSTANELEFEPNSLHYRDTKPTREELLEYYHSFVYQEQNLSIHTEEAVISIKAGKPLTVITNRDSYQAYNVLVAVGVMGLVNKLNVPGETQERVSYFFTSADPYKDKEIVVIGGGNSAAETCLDLCNAQAKVTMVLRRPSLERVGQGAGIKPWVREPLEAAWQTGKLSIIFDAQIKEIFPSTINLEVKGQIREIPCDHIFALTGTRPDVSLLKEAGAIIGVDGKPEYNSETFETTIANLFVTGHLTRELHMKNAILLPPQIVKNIAKMLVK